ncbi:hypothetical protein Btru_065308 [Bulinus truncatus]|nr:hypothetical protein Btru_065308 [Bulinus truncatus]
MKVFVFCLLAVNFILALFLKGFFPVKIVSKEHATSKIKWDTIEKGPVTYKKVVLMIIDALRSDFAFGIDNFFPKAQAIIKNGHGIGFTAEMQPPTVTLPRIKAIVTGDTPSFADVVHNFAATAVEEDSVLLQLRKEKRKIFFFGDDTWIKLFPGYFDKSDGTSSFFVSDFTEVDSNVSRHLSNELSFPEWDLMILHYLGLDHIGHVTGPHSPLIQPKLSAMDAAIDQIYSAMEKWNDLSLLIICGDHGMSDQGGHGGGSLAEITVPVLFLSPHWLSGHDVDRRMMTLTGHDVNRRMRTLTGHDVDRRMRTLTGHDVDRRMRTLTGHDVNRRMRTLTGHDVDRRMRTLTGHDVDRRMRTLTGHDVNRRMRTLTGHDVNRRMRTLTGHDVDRRMRTLTGHDVNRRMRTLTGHDVNRRMRTLTGHDVDRRMRTLTGHDVDRRMRTLTGHDVNRRMRTLTGHDVNRRMRTLTGHDVNRRMRTLTGHDVNRRMRTLTGHDVNRRMRTLTGHDVDRRMRT